VDAPAADEATPPPRVSLDAAAWLLYTSGSSGFAKGVLGSHRGLLNRLVWGLREEPFGSGEVCCLKTRLSFVDSLWELLGPLVGGARLLVLGEEAVRDARVLAQVLVRERVTRLVAVPSLLASLVELAPGELAASRLRRVTSSGEPLSGELAERLLALVPGLRLLNLYGSTEVTADATWYPVPADQKEGRVPIGRPLANVRVRVLGPGGELVPVGAVGELHVGGAGLALGYHGRAAAETEQRFLPDRFAPGERLYRTGDLARWRPDGQLEYLGRADRQLKVRGVRVEPGELEHALRSHEAVREAAVLARPGPDGPELIAYVELTQPDTSADTLRAHLRTSLPDQLLPTHLLPLPQLPRLPSGKIDRTTLTEHEPAAAATAESTPLRTTAERLVAEAYGEVLGVPAVGAYDDFFALGGHSLLATRLASALSSRFEIALPLAWVFEHPVVADFARAVEDLLLAEIRDDDARAAALAPTEAHAR
jgi:amino acid adenylation domain-containing protein